MGEQDLFSLKNKLSSDDLDWYHNFSNVLARATETLGFLCQNYSLEGRETQEAGQRALCFSLVLDSLLKITY